jgi:hypothetical protein
MCAGSLCCPLVNDNVLYHAQNKTVREAVFCLCVPEQRLVWGLKPREALSDLGLQQSYNR